MEKEELGETRVWFLVIERMVKRGDQETRDEEEGTRRSGTNFSVPFMSENMASEKKEQKNFPVTIDFCL